MSPVDALLIVLAGAGAGIVNTIVGSGTLLSFPTLLFLGYPPITANISNSLGLCAAGVTGVYGYRRELEGLGGVLRQAVPCSLLSGVSGALLLLLLPGTVFRVVVPVLIGIAVLLVML